MRMNLAHPPSHRLLRQLRSSPQSLLDQKIGSISYHNRKGMASACQCGCAKIVTLLRLCRSGEGPVNS